MLEMLDLRAHVLFALMQSQEGLLESVTLVIGLPVPDHRRTTNASGSAILSAFMFTDEALKVVGAMDEVCWASTAVVSTQ